MTGCRFSFPQIQGIQVKRLVHTLLTSDDSTSEDIIKRLQEKLSTLTGARLARSADTLGTLWEELSKARADPMEKGPSTISSVSTRCPRFIRPLVESPQQQVSPPKILDSVKAALLHSIYTGSFVDRQFFARSLRGRGGSPRPIYLSSAAAGEWLRLIQGGTCHRVFRPSDGPHHLLVFSCLPGGR